MNTTAQPENWCDMFKFACAGYNSRRTVHKALELSIWYLGRPDSKLLQ